MKVIILCLMAAMTMGGPVADGPQERVLFTSCVNNACLSLSGTHYCSGFQCLPRKPMGSSCTDNNQCETGNCEQVSTKRGSRVGEEAVDEDEAEPKIFFIAAPVRRQCGKCTRNEQCPKPNQYCKLSDPSLEDHGTCAQKDGTGAPCLMSNPGACMGGACSNVCPVTMPACNNTMPGHGFCL